MPPTSAFTAKSTRVLALVVCAALLAAACSSPTEAGSPEAPTPTPATSLTPEPSNDPTAPPTTGPGSEPTPSPTGDPFPTGPPRPTPRSDTEPDGFVTHTLSRLTSHEDYYGLARDGIGGQLVTKFTIVDFSNDPDLVWYDSNFFTLHDEWFWFRLLNGHPVANSPYDPVPGLRFETVDEIYRWANAQDEDDLPIDLQVRNDGRLVITELYSIANADVSVARRQRAMDKLGVYDRYLAFGALIHYPAGVSANGEDRWLLELEFGDTAPVDDLEVIFDTVSSRVTPEIAERLEWVVRSPVQENVAQRLEMDDHPLGERLVRYEELAVPGEVQVYSSSITAGRLTRVGEGERRGFDDTDEFSIILTDQVPDFLPPAAALLTAVPQTPLAHVNILARNRGIPNAYLGGLLDDPNLNSMARVQAPALVYAAGPDQLEIVPLTEAQYMSWFELRSPEPIAVPPVDTGAVPYAIDLTELSGTIEDERELAAYRPIIGGKAAGFISLIAPGTVTVPDRPLSITVRSFVEHQSLVETELNAMLDDDDFGGSARARFLFLEGPEDYDKVYTEPADIEFRDRILAQHSPTSALGRILAADGFKKFFRQRAMAPQPLAEITASLEDSFGDYAPSQGLRFRSSSSVEDIEGFNGAGLYDSNTGFLDPTVQQDPGDVKKSVEWAIKKTWASYWGFEAFEERELERVDHLSGAMGVLVHARFDDPLEITNGVFTFTVLPSEGEHRYAMEVNVQAGDVSVTNPTPGSGALPEAVTVQEAHNGDLTIERIAPSTLVPGGVDVLSDDDILLIFGQARDVAEAWLERTNAARPPSQRAQILTLDFEFREMAAGWPARSDGPTEQPRIVIKQARSLDPGARLTDDALRILPIPADVLTRARRIERRTCSADDVVITLVEVTTDPVASPDPGHSIDALTAQLLINFRSDVPELGVEAGDRLTLDWRSVDSTHPTALAGGDRWDATLGLAENGLGLTALSLLSDRTYTIGAERDGVHEGQYTCVTEPLLRTPEDYLLSLLPGALG